jgi:hypothetical protein
MATLRVLALVALVGQTRPDNISNSTNTSEPYVDPEFRSQLKRSAMWPEGGEFTTPVAVTLEAPELTAQVADDIQMHYTICMPTDTFCTKPNGKTSKWISSMASITLRESCLVTSAAFLRGLRITQYTRGYFEVATGRYGYGYFVPYYNDVIGFSGRVARLDLRSQGVEPDFANFQSYESQGAYDNQLHMLDLTELDPDLKGFQGGFSAIGRSTDDVDGAQTYTNYAYLVPYFNGRHFGKLVRLNLDYFDLCGTSTQVRLNTSSVKGAFPPQEWIFQAEAGRWQERILPKTAGFRMTETENDAYLQLNKGTTADMKVCGVDVIDLEVIDPMLRGFIGGFTHQDTGYLVPNFNGVNFTSKVVRFNTTTFSDVQVLDLDLLDPELRGFHGGFTYGKYGYLVPYRTTKGPNFGEHQGSHNSKEQTDANKLQPVYHGKMVRLDLDTVWNKTPWSDLTRITVLDLGKTDRDLKGYSGGFTSGKYAYLTPYTNRETSTPSRRNSGKVARVNLEDFKTVEVLDLSKADPDLKGFHGGFVSGKYGYFVPFNNGMKNDRGVTTSFGKVAIVDLDDFSVAGVRVLDMTKKSRLQIPGTPIRGLTGFIGGYAAGDFAYFVPHNNGAFYGQVVRLHLVEDTVQVIDMQLDDPALSGFSGGFTHRDRSICCNRKIGHRNGDPIGHCEELAPDRFTYCGSREYEYKPFPEFSDLETSMTGGYKAVQILGKPESNFQPVFTRLVMREVEYAIYEAQWNAYSLKTLGIGARPYKFRESGLYGMLESRLNEQYGYWKGQYLWTRHMAYKINRETNSEGSKCCHFEDQHRTDYVLWDRRAYSRGERKKQTCINISPVNCQFDLCKKDDDANRRCMLSDEDLQDKIGY